jgi:hypothetical protein
VAPISDAVWTADETTRQRIVRNAIADHYRHSGGRLPAFGKIIGYTLVTETASYCDVGLPYDVEGNSAGALGSIGRPGSATWPARDKPISGSRFYPRCPRAETSLENIAGRPTENVKRRLTSDRAPIFPVCAQSQAHRP